MMTAGSSRDLDEGEGWGTGGSMGGDGAGSFFSRPVVVETGEASVASGVALLEGAGCCLGPPESGLSLLLSLSNFAAAASLVVVEAAAFGCECVECC
jgi:hypothetical protein